MASNFSGKWMKLRAFLLAAGLTITASSVHVGSILSINKAKADYVFTPPISYDLKPNSVYGVGGFGEIASKLEHIISSEAHTQVPQQNTQVPQQIVQGYSLTDGPIANAYEIILRLVFPSETLKDFVGINYGDNPWDDLLGLISYSLNSFYIYSPRYAPSFSTRIHADLRSFLPQKDFRRPEVMKVRWVNYSDGNSIHTLAFAYDNFAQIHALKPVDIYRFEYLGNSTSFFETFFGDWPAEMVSVNDTNDGTIADKTLYVKHMDGSGAKYSWQRIISDIINGVARTTPIEKKDNFFDLFGHNLSALVRGDAGFYHADTITALNLNGGPTDAFYVLRTANSGRIPLQPAADIRAYNQNVSLPNRAAGIITRWEPPVNIFYHSSQVNEKLVKENARYSHLAIGIALKLIDLDKNPANIEEGIEVKVSRNGLDYYEYRGDYNARGGIDEVYSNNRAKRGTVILSPEVASCSADLPICRYFFRRGLLQALGYLKFSNEKGVVGTGYGTPSLNFFDLSVRDKQMFEWLNRIPHGYTINADGTLRQIR